MNSRYRLKRNKLVAWLGILAIWLAVVAPVISQTLAASAREAFLTAQSWPLCTEHDHRHAGVVASNMSSMSDDMPGMSGMPGMDHQIDSHGGACGYCGLLADHPPIANTVLVLFVGTAELVQSVSPTCISVFVAPDYDASRPRAPPSFVS